MTDLVDMNYLVALRRAFFDVPNSPIIKSFVNISAKPQVTPTRRQILTSQEHLHLPWVLISANLCTWRPMLRLQR